MAHAGATAPLDGQGGTFGFSGRMEHAVAPDQAEHGLLPSVASGPTLIPINATPELGLRSARNPNRALLLKRAMDVTLALTAVAALAPVMLLIALMIKLDSRGPALYRQTRNGLAGREFLMVKFRTLHSEACARPDGPCRQVTRGDPRVTRVGRFLRWTSLDELPQLFNVLRGEMSIIGPRPHPIALNEHYAGRIAGYRDRHAVKPGITGWAQINGLRGETETLDKMERRVRHDLAYIEHWTLMLDLRIIARTLRLGFLDRSQAHGRR